MRDIVFCNNIIPRIETLRGDDKREGTRKPTSVVKNISYTLSYFMLQYLKWRPTVTERISLFIIAKNEETKIAKCIISARDLVSEIIVVDAFSKDKTVAVAKEMGAQVFQHAFDGFANQKNFALSKVHYPWALNLDADESLSDDLKKQIRKTLADTKHAGFEIGFSNYFLGKRMRFSGLNQERHIRLVRTKQATYEGGLVHEGLKVNGTIGRLKGPICHYSYPDIETYFRKFNRYTTLAAKQMQRNDKKFHLLWVLFTLPFEFIKRYVLKLGFLDGLRGFVWASFSTFYVFVKHLKFRCFRL